MMRRKIASSSVSEGVNVVAHGAYFMVADLRGDRLTLIWLSQCDG
jgi:hypothetical protein